MYLRNSWTLLKTRFKVVAFYYHAMQYSAKRAIAIACRLSVRPSVCLSVRLSVTLVDQDHIGWKSWKLIARTISPKPPLFVAQRLPPTPRGTWENFGRLGVGWEKVAFLSTEVAISLKHIKIEEMLLQSTYIGTHQRSFEQYHPRPPTASSSLRLGVRNPHPKRQSLLSQEWVFGRYIHRVRPNKFWRKGSVGVFRDCPNFLDTACYLRNW